MQTQAIGTANPQAVVDRRKRMAVFLYKSDRPEVVRWHCPYCKNFVAEIVNREVRTVTDIVSFADSDIGGPGVRCNGSIRPGVKCHVHFYFLTGSQS